MEQDSSVERTLCQLPAVHVFRIPPRSSADGYRAADWPKDPNWSGKLKVIAKGNQLAIILTDAQNNTFAICHVADDGCVERTLDSGRYFVLKITNAQGRHAFIGIAFNERSDAFDFNVALSTFKTEIEREKVASTTFLPSHEAQDFSLKSGEKIKIKLVSVVDN
jgi:adaptin ear-binding coat-associated protein 1/2